MKKIISSREADKKKRNAAEPVFWDSVETEGEERFSTFTGLKYESC